jgi:hypothetical protein
LAQQEQACVRLMSVPGIGPISRARWCPQSALAMCSPKVATSPAWLRLVRNRSPILGNTSKRMLLIVHVS